MINKKNAAMALSVCFWANYVCDKIKMCRKSENAAVGSTTAKGREGYVPECPVKNYNNNNNNNNKNECHSNIIVDKLQGCSHSKKLRESESESRSSKVV